MNQKNDLDQDIRFAICLSLFLSYAGFLFIFASLYIDINLPNTNTNYWFQRSGSVAVLLSAIAEFSLLGVNAIINYPEVVYAADDTYKIKYGKKFKCALRLTTLTLIVGTLI